MFKTVNLSNIVQIAYYVSDIESAARKTNQVLGTGPFYLYKNIALENVTYRNEDSTLDHSSAYAQSGSIMLEFTQQNDNQASVFTEMYPDRQEGLHHVAIFVEDVQAAMDELNEKGIDTVTHFFTRDGHVEVAFMDFRSMLGHMVEIYQPVDALKKFYRAVASAAENWDGNELFIRL